MANKKIDPRIYLPPIDHEYREEFTQAGDYDGLASDEAQTITAGLYPPENIFVVDQIARKGADGRTVVDLVLEVEDMPGASEYEVRVSTV